MDQTRHGKRFLDRMDSPTTTTTECTLDESTSSSSSSFSVGTPILSMRFCKVQVPPQLWRKETDDGCTTADNTLCDTPTVLQIPLDAFCGVDDEEPTIVVRGVNDHHDEDADLAVHQTTVAKGPSLSALKRAIVEACTQAGLPHTAARLHESLLSSSSSSSWGLRYRDREGDVVSITSNAVLYQALLDHPNHPSSSTLRLELIVPPSLLEHGATCIQTTTTSTTTHGSVEETLLRQLQEELHAGLQAQQHVLNALMEQVQELKLQQQQAQAQQQTQTAESSPRSLVVHNSNDTSSKPSNNNKNNNTSLLTMTPSLSAKEKIAVLLEAARGGPARLVSSSSLSSSSSQLALERVQQRRVDWERTTQYMESLRLEVGILKEILKRERDLSHCHSTTSRSSSTTKNRRASLRRMRWMVAVTTSPTTVVASEEAVPLSSPRRPAHPRGAWMSRFWNHHNTVPSN